MVRNKVEHMYKFEEIMLELHELVNEALEITKETMGKESQAVSQARAYWYNQIKEIIDGSGSMETMKNTLEKIIATVEN